MREVVSPIILNWTPTQLHQRIRMKRACGYLRHHTQVYRCYIAFEGNNNEQSMRLFQVLGVLAVCWSHLQHIRVMCEEERWIILCLSLSCSNGKQAQCAIYVSCACTYSRICCGNAGRIIGKCRLQVTIGLAWYELVTRSFALFLGTPETKITQNWLRDGRTILTSVLGI